MLATLFLFSIRSFAALANYANLDQENRMAMDKLTREIRQARQVQAFNTNASGNSLTILNGTGQQITYSFDQVNRRMTRSAGGDTSVLLTNCNLLDFQLFQRTPSNDFGVYSNYYGGNWTQHVKVVQLSWKTGRTLPNGLVNSENIQTARIVIRKQADD
jgi:hypothetical protein